MSKANRKFAKVDNTPEKPKISREENEQNRIKAKNYNNSKKMI
jgi:hypothetical protein